MGDRSVLGPPIEALKRAAIWAIDAGSGSHIKRLRAIGIAVTALALMWLGLYATGVVPSSQELLVTESGRLPQVGLSRSVEILRDARGIPHITAIVERDAWQALGFVHAQDRLAQMLFFRRLARGRIAEVVGEEGVNSDRMARTLGIGPLAEREFGRVPAATRKTLTSYAIGVNAQIERIRSRDAVPSPTLLEPIDEIEPWRAQDSIAILKLISFSSGNRLETGLVLDDLFRRLGSQRARPFGPTGYRVAGLEFPNEEINGEWTPLSPPRKPADSPAPGRTLVRSTRMSGGTAWVLGGEKTRSGFPFLVANLNLPTTVPALIYEMQLKSEHLDVVGATVPGIPVVWAGRNRHVAWAVLAAPAVTLDLYRERVREAEQEYDDGNRWVPLETREELIRVREASGFKRHPLVIRSTAHGPLIDFLAEEVGGGSFVENGAAGEGTASEESYPTAIAWTGMQPGDGISSLLGLVGAGSASSIRRVLENHHEPAVTVVFADENGEGGAQTAGWLPRRTLPSSLRPLPGWMRIYDWRESVPYESLPAIRMAPSEIFRREAGSAWLAVADGEIGKPTEGSEIEWLWGSEDRVRRIEERLQVLASEASDSRGLDLKRVAALQWDVAAGDAADIVLAVSRLAALSDPLRPEAREVVDLLSSWDGKFSSASTGAIAYELLMQNLSEAFFKPALGADLYARYRSLPEVRLQSLLASILVTADRDRLAGGWADLDRVVVQLHESLRVTWVGLVRRLGPSRKGWRWSRLRHLKFRPVHATNSNWESPPGLDGDGVAGNENSIFSTVLVEDSESGLSRAPTYQVAIDLAAPNRILSSLVPGQSEYPGDEHFIDGLENWLAGRSSTLLTSRLLIEENSGAALVLEPVSR